MTPAVPSPADTPARRPQIEEILARLPKPVQRTRTGWRSSCPSCGGRADKLSIAEGIDGRPLLHCFGGCRFAAIADALGLERPASRRVRRGPYTLADAREEAIRRLLGQRWNSAAVLETYRRADEIRARVQYVRAVRHAAAAVAENETWEALADVASVEDEIRRLEATLDEAGA